MNKMKQANATATTRAAANKILWLNFMFLVIKRATAKGLVKKGRQFATLSGFALLLFRPWRAKD
ncbi:hypothetical protein EMIT0P2_150053 [Pseudomonas sp. IT-P2]